MITKFSFCIFHIVPLESVAIVLLLLFYSKLSVEEGESLHDKCMFKTSNGKMTKWWDHKEGNSETTFLNRKNKWLPVFLLCPVAISLHSKNWQNSAQHVKTHKSCCAITFVTFCSWPIPVTWSLSFQGSLLFPGASQFSKRCQFLPEPHPLPKNPLIQVTPCLAELGGPWCLTFAFRQLENLRFFIQIICWAP